MYENQVKKPRKRRKPLTFTKYNLTYKGIAKAFGYSSAKSFASSRALRAMLRGIDWIISQVEEHNSTTHWISIDYKGYYRIGVKVTI